MIPSELSNWKFWVATVVVVLVVTYFLRGSTSAAKKVNDVLDRK